MSVLRYPPSSHCTSCWLRVGGAPPWGRSAKGQHRQGPEAGEPQAELGSEQGPQELQGQSNSQGPEGCRAVGIQTSLGCLRECGEVTKGGRRARAGRGAQWQCQAWVVLSSELPGAPHNHTPREAWARGYSSSWLNPGPGFSTLSSKSMLAKPDRVGNQRGIQRSAPQEALPWKSGQASAQGTT